MDTLAFGKLKKQQKRHRPEVSRQTGFPSAATHYTEPAIDLHLELVSNQEATFFVRVDGNAYCDLSIYHQDVLVIDRSLHPKRGDLLLVVSEGSFTVVKFDKKLNEAAIVWGVITYVIHKTR